MDQARIYAFAERYLQDFIGKEEVNALAIVHSLGQMLGVQCPLEVDQREFTELAAGTAGECGADGITVINTIYGYTYTSDHDLSDKELDDLMLNKIRNEAGFKFEGVSVMTVMESEDKPRIRLYQIKRLESGKINEIIHIETNASHRFVGDVVNVTNLDG